MLDDNPDKWPPMLRGRRKVVSRGKVAFEFDGLIDYVEQAEVMPPHSYKSSREIGNKSWYGTDSFEEAAKLCRDGWDEGVKTMHTAVKDIELIANMNTPQRFQEYAVAGYFPNVPLFCSGEQEHMVCKTVEQQINRLQIELVVNASVTCGISPKTVANFGAAIAAYIDKMESTGARVGLTLLFTMHGGNGGVDIRVRVKQPDQALPLPVLAFTLINAATFRRLGFSIGEQVYYRDWHNIFLGVGYGTSTSTPYEALPSNIWLIDRLQNWGGEAWNKPETAIKTIGEKLAKLAEHHNQTDFAAVLRAA